MLWVHKQAVLRCPSCVSSHIQSRPACIAEAKCLAKSGAPSILTTYVCFPHLHIIITTCPASLAKIQVVQASLAGRAGALLALLIVQQPGNLSHHACVCLFTDMRRARKGPMPAPLPPACDLLTRDSRARDLAHLHHSYLHDRKEPGA